MTLLLLAIKLGVLIFVAWTVWMVLCVLLMALVSWPGERPASPSKRYSDENSGNWVKP